MGVVCSAPSFALHTTQLDQIRYQTFSQSKHGLPWVSEFKCIQHLPNDAPMPASSRLISTPSVGQIASAGCRTIGIHRTPEEFVQTALEAGHPRLSHNMLPEPMCEASRFCADHSEQFVARHRSEKLRQMIQRAKELSEQEESLKGSISSRRRKVFENKRMLLFDELLVEAEFQDTNLVKGILQGSCPHPSTSNPDISQPIWQQSR